MSIKSTLPNMRTADPLAILMSDVHLSHTPPIARSVEPDWYVAMGRPLQQVCELQEKLNGIACIIAGDVFHHWKAPPELINFAIEHLPSHCYAVPGQHDLPLHQLEDIHKSAYWTLVRGQKMMNLAYNHPIALGNMRMHGFPWGTEPYPLMRAKEKDFVSLKRSPNMTKLVRVAVVHAYCSTKEASHPAADRTSRVAHWKKKLDGFQAAVFGDNHQGFLSSVSGPVVLNSGALIRRRVDEYNYQPQVGVLFSNGMIDLVKLDVSADRFIDIAEACKIAEKAFDFCEVIADLAELKESAFDFAELLKEFLERSGISKSVKTIILEALERRNG